jgi:hypothetical protein
MGTEARRTADLPVSRESGGRAIAIPINAGDTVPIPQRGTQFYLQISTGTVNIRARAGSAGAGDFSLFTQGTGDKSKNPFDIVEINNPNAFPVVLQIWIGFDDFIDNRLILSNATIPNVTYPTQPDDTATNIPIPDLSGGPFLDLNGNKWLALFRIAIIISNTSTGTTLLLQKFGSVVANGPAAVIIPAGLVIGHNSSGDFSMSVGGGVIPAIVSEIYQAIQAT